MRGIAEIVILDAERYCMGIYLNPNNVGFWKSVRSKIYVDKTKMIAYTNECLNTREQFICVSRPRRFGKSMALDMLAAYYSNGCDSDELFAKYKIAKEKSFHEHLNKYDVIFLNIQRFLSSAKQQGMIAMLEQAVIAELRELYGSLFSEHETILPMALSQIYAKTNKQFIFLIDEWDCVMRERQEAETLQREYLDFLRNLLKDQPYVALAYMTGILPIKKYGTHSALNMFIEYSMIDPDIFEEYTGFTETEVQILCEKYNMDFEEVSRWYDGYSFMEFKHVYNPQSVVEAMRRHKLESYWTKTETYEALKVYIDMDFEGLREDIIQMLGKNSVKVNTKSFQNDMCTFHTKDDVLTLLIHLGYLAYNAETEEAFIPNNEIVKEFENAMSISGWQDVMEVLKASDRLLENTLLCDGDSVAKALDKAHTEVASVLTYNDENSLSCAISIAYYSARKYYRIIREMPTGHGFADIVFLPLKKVDKPVLVVELKYDKNVNAAICQIKEKRYMQALEDYSGEILLVGINYDKRTKTHSCVIEKHIK